MAGPVLKVLLISLIFGYSFLLEGSREVPTVEIISPQLVHDYFEGKVFVVTRFFKTVEAIGSREDFHSIVFSDVTLDTLREMIEEMLNLTTHTSYLHHC